VLLLYVLPRTYKSPVPNEPSGFRSNAPMPKGAASKSFITHRTIFLVANELLDTPVGMDDEDLLPCGCEWKLAAVELLVKYKVDCLCRYDHQGNVVSLPLVSTELSLNNLVANELSRLLLLSTLRTALSCGTL
jgi:hypothetical protein